MLGIILVDPPLRHNFVCEGAVSKDAAATYFSQIRLFGGGYVDFGTSSEVANGLRQSGDGPTRTTMLDDLVHYWTRGFPPVFDVADPDLLSLSYYPLKIAAG